MACQAAKTGRKRHPIRLRRPTSPTGLPLRSAHHDDEPATGGRGCLGDSKLCPLTSDNESKQHAGKGNPLYEIFGITRYWRYGKANMETKIRQGRVIQPGAGSVPRETRYLDETKGSQLATVWTDIPPVNSQAKERLGYPTQKPEALLERIIQTSTNAG